MQLKSQPNLTVQIFGVQTAVGRTKSVPLLLLNYCRFGHWDEVSWSEQGADNTSLMGSNSIQTTHLRVGLDKPCGSLPMQDILRVFFRKLRMSQLAELKISNFPHSLL